MPNITGDSGGGVSHRENVKLSNKYNQFNSLLSSANAYLAITENLTRLKVTAEQTAALVALTSPWAVNYAKYLTPDTHTRTVVIEADRLYKITESALRKIQQQIKNNGEVVLSGADYLALGIHKDKDTKTPTPIETVAPNIVMIKASRLSNDFYTTYPDSEGNAHRRLPHRNHLIIKVAHTAAADVMPAESDYDEIHQSGKATFTLIAPANTPIGTIGYVKACYVTFTGKAGPDSEAFKFVIN